MKENAIQLTAVFMEVPEGFVGFVEELPGANTQGETLEEARENLREAVQMVLDANREIAERSIVGKTVSKEPFDLSAPGNELIWFDILSPMDANCFESVQSTHFTSIHPTNKCGASTSGGQGFFSSEDLPGSRYPLTVIDEIG